MAVHLPRWATGLLLFTLACGGRIDDVTPPTGGGAGGAGGSGGAAPDLYPHLACDPLVPEYCGFPFPSNVFSVPDATTPTGRRVDFLAEGLPKPKNDYANDPAPWNKADGFSPGGTIATFFAGASPEGLVAVTDLGPSISPASKTVLLDAETGALILHWAELDKSTTNDDTRSLLIHPAVPLRDGHRYIVAVQGLVDAQGAALPASPAFAALRDGTPFDDPSIDARRTLYKDLFGKLTAAGLAQENLQLAWDFTTASRESNTAWLVKMRDDAFARVGDAGPPFTITSVDSDYDPANIAVRIRGTMSVPLYLDQYEPGGALVFGEDGLPAVNATTPTHDVEWELLIPNSATPATPAKLLQYGHGLLGSHEDVESGVFPPFCNTFNYAVFSTKWIGLAEEDEGWIAAQLAGGKADVLSLMFDRLHQGMINNLLVMRMMSRGMTADPTYGPLLDGDQRFYWGISQGGISGGVYMALSEDVTRGALEVMGQPYSLLLNRSVDFDPFFNVLGLQFPDARAQQHFLGLVQMTWDRVEPNGYSKYLFTDPFEGSPTDRRVLMRAAIGDHQVSTFGAHIMARAVGAQHLDTGLRDVYGLDTVAGPIDQPGAVYAEWQFGLPAEPVCNLPLDVCEDPHGKLRKLADAQTQLDQFFRTGVVANTCAGGVCDHGDLSGCTGMEDPNPCD